MTETKLIFTPYIARELIRRGHEVVDIKPNKADKKRTVLVFKVDDTFYTDFGEIVSEKNKKNTEE